MTYIKALFIFTLYFLMSALPLEAVSWTGLLAPSRAIDVQRLVNAALGGTCVTGP